MFFLRRRKRSKVVYNTAYEQPQPPPQQPSGTYYNQGNNQYQGDIMAIMICLLNRHRAMFHLLTQKLLNLHMVDTMLNNRILEHMSNIPDQMALLLLIPKLLDNYDCFLLLIRLDYLWFMGFKFRFV